jgi:hypothetical protein
VRHQLTPSRNPGSTPARTIAAAPARTRPSGAAARGVRRCRRDQDRRDTRQRHPDRRGPVLGGGSLLLFHQPRPYLG